MNFIIILLLCLFVQTTPASAITATPSATSEKVEDVKDILKQIVKDSSSDSSEISTDKPKSFFGNITQINDSQVTINVQNQNKVLQISTNTSYVDAKRQKSKLTNFKVGQTVLAMGYYKDDQSVDCKRIVATDLKTVENTNQVVTGQIVDVSQTSPIFVLIPSQNKNNQYQIKTDSKTEIIDLKNNSLTSTKTIVTGKKIIAIIKPDGQISQTFYASKIISLETLSPTPTSKP